MKISFVVKKHEFLFDMLTDILRELFLLVCLPILYVTFVPCIIVFMLYPPFLFIFALVAAYRICQGIAEAV
jgi:hypothetical protein